jgi:hypothetical protein
MLEYHLIFILPLRRGLFAQCGKNPKNDSFGALMNARFFYNFTQLSATPTGDYFPLLGATLFVCACKDGFFNHSYFSVIRSRLFFFMACCVYGSRL